MFGIIFYYLNWFTSVDGKTERCALLLPNHRRRINDGYQHDVPAVGVWQNIHHWECTWPSSSVRTRLGLSGGEHRASYMVVD